MRALLDENLPLDLARQLTPHDVRHGARADAPVYHAAYAASHRNSRRGKVVVEGDPLPEGAIVTILARELDETFEVPPELEVELLESNRGETIPADELLERLRRTA